MNLYEIDTRIGCAYQLSRLFCGVAPCGGEVVCAPSQKEAVGLWHRYNNGEKDLKGAIMLDGQDYSYRNIICEKKYHATDW